ncbi:MAG: type II secretion system major pseudopilin GspG [Candidatus Hydrogenedentes bacterium]|nr:type II secretion system major pseudopilin GspG [Candidatus Hydrogenedentota bacterium]
MNTQREKGRRAATSGFTLVELMVVIAIIAILATIVGFNVLGAIGEGNIAGAQAQIKQFENAIVAYKIKFKRLPASLEDLAHPPKGDPLMESIPNDPWGNAYQYSVEGSSKYKIISYGGDGSPGGTDEDADISTDKMAAD